ncbi:MAG: FAD-dependent oxidoreductase [Candidatus Saccharimonadales bacterium]
MIARFKYSNPESESITTFFFEPERPVVFTAGQFIEMNLPHDTPDDRGIKRWFTLSSAPNHELVSITTRFDQQRSSSFKQALRALKPGDEVMISDPMGDFVLPKQTDTPLVFVAGGIGITPFHSILQHMAVTHEQRPIKMLVGVRNENDIIFQETFDDAHQHVTFIVSQASAAWGGERGRLSAELILGLEQPTDDTLIYLSGPEAMVETLYDDLVKAGFKKRQLVGDYFPNYSENY